MSPKIRQMKKELYKLIACYICTIIAFGYYGWYLTHLIPTTIYQVIPIIITSFVLLMQLHKTFNSTYK